MNTKEIYQLTTAIFCVIILIHCTSSQPLSVNSEENDDMIDSSIWMKPSSVYKSNDESLSNPFFVPSEYKQINPPNSSEPVRRANFWKRANFWRKRANFWRRNLAS